MPLELGRKTIFENGRYLQNGKATLLIVYVAADVWREFHYRLRVVEREIWSGADAMTAFVLRGELSDWVRDLVKKGMGGSAMLVVFPEDWSRA